MKHLIYKYEVQVLNRARQYFKEVNAALDYASRECYISPSYGKPDEIRAKLELGQAFQYTYGFNEVSIIPINNEVKS